MADNSAISWCVRDIDDPRWPEDLRLRQWPEEE